MENDVYLKSGSYLGDGLYVRDDGFHVWFYTHNGVSATNEVALDPYVLDQFIAWLERTRGLKITIEKLPNWKPEYDAIKVGAPEGSDD